MKALSTDEHLRRGSYRRDRHGPKVPVDDRGRLLHGLPPAAQQIAAALFDAFNWNPAMLIVLRAFALSCDRVERLQSAGTVNVGRLYDELRVLVDLLHVLNLDAYEPPAAPSAS